MAATDVASPVSSTESPSAMSTGPPGMCTVARSPDSSQSRPAAAVAQAPVPQAWVGPTPRS